MKSFTQLLLFCCIVFASINALAQTQSPALKGAIQSNQRSIDGATISLLKAKDSSLIKMAVTDKTGGFIFDKAPDGKYIVLVSAIGYKKAYSNPFEIRLGQPVVMPTLELVIADKNLGDVVVTGRRPMVEQKLDRMIVNVESQASNVGLSALEVLEKSPGITVDKDGNISLKGKQGVLILIDGKPSYLSGSDLTNYLQNIPSSQLELLEIMTNPPAKFDAAGNAGVINIKTKKNKAKGMNGSFTVGAGMGYYPSSNNSFNMNYRNNKWNLFGNYSINYRRNFQDLSIVRNFRDQQTHELLSTFDQHSRLERWNLGNNLKVGADFYASPKTTLGVVLSGFSNHEENNNKNTTLINDANGNLITRTEADNQMDLDFKNMGINFNMRHQFDSTGKEITADIDFLGYDNSNQQYLNNYFFDKDGQKHLPDELIYGNLPSNIKIFSAKSDFSRPLKNNARFDAGFKTSFVRTDNDAQYYQRNSVDEPWEVDEGRTNHFIYTENINAAYVNLQKKLGKKWNSQMGLRLENTNAKGEQKTTSENFKRNYTQLFPTFYLQYKASEKHSFVVNYGRRIERPSYRDMNPFMYFLDKYTFQMGNPNLQPQFAHNIEFTHSFRGFLNTTLNYTNTTDLITEVFEQDDATNTTFLKKDNVASRKQVGISVNAGMPVTKWWRTNIYVNGFYNEFDGYVNNGPISTSMLSWMTNIQNTFTFKKGWSAELSGFYRSEMLEGVLVSQPMGVINMAVSKRIIKDKGTLRLNFRDPFDLQYFRGAANYQNIDITIRNEWDNRVVNLSFSYKFGKPLKGQQPRRQVGGASDEQNRVSTGSN